MSASHLCPLPGALADELAISAMVKALRPLSDFDLSDQRLRAFIYVDSKIPLPDIYRLDPAALKVELIWRDAMREPKEAAE